VVPHCCEIVAAFHRQLDPLPVVVVDPAAPLPATCADIALPTDGEYTLYVGGDKGKPWTAYCADMATTPVEYLPLAMVLGDHNVSQYTAGGASPGTSVRTVANVLAYAQ
jgi:hypothetical protein